MIGHWGEVSSMGGVSVAAVWGTRVNWGGRVNWSGGVNRGGRVNRGGGVNWGCGVNGGVVFLRTAVVDSITVGIDGHLAETFTWISTHSGWLFPV